MSNTNVETVSSTVDRIKLALAVLVIIAGIVAFSVLEDQPTVARVGIFIGSVVVAALIAWFSEPGRRSLGYARDSYNECKRVVWPTCKETTEMSAIVFVFVAVMGWFLLLVDKTMGWVIYGLLLGWR